MRPLPVMAAIALCGGAIVQGIALFREHPLVGCPERAILFTAHLRYAAS